MRRTILVFALFYLSSCKAIHAQDGVEVVYMRIGGEALGLTVCSETNQPIILLDNSLIGKIEAGKEILFHEFTHVGQAREYPGGCKAMGKRYREDAEFRFEVEWTAYCRQFARGVLLRQAPKSVAIEYLAAFMENNYPTKQTPQQIMTRSEACFASLPDSPPSITLLYKSDME